MNISQECRQEIHRRMNEIIRNNKNFAFSYVTLKEYHEKIFRGMNIGIAPEEIGEFRTVNLHREERILLGKEIKYADFQRIREYLEYDFLQEKAKRYSGMPNAVVLRNVADFTSNIWQTHPFRDGNTRTIFIFMLNYLSARGIRVEDDKIKIAFENLEYLRNALVRANCSILYNGIPENKIYISHFFEVLLGIKEHNLDNAELFINQENANKSSDKIVK